MVAQLGWMVGLVDGGLNRGWIVGLVDGGLGGGRLGECWAQ